MNCCKKCADKLSLPEDYYLNIQYAQCGLCNEMSDCTGISTDVLFDKILKPQYSSDYVDPIYEMVDGDHIDLDQLVDVSGLTTNSDGRKHFNVIFKNIKNTFYYNIPKDVDGQREIQQLIKAWRKYKYYESTKKA